MHQIPKSDTVTNDITVMSTDDSTSSNNSYEQEAPTAIVPAEVWFQQGRRVLYDPDHRRIVTHKLHSSVHVWERVVTPPEVFTHSRWLTLLPGPPEGSYGFSKVDTHLQIAPRLYVEFVGLGDSDKPKNYAHSIMDRANLVEAQWRAHKIRRTVLVCASSSSMVMMELLNRQRERLALGLPPRTRIEHVLCINGGYYASGHTPTKLNKSPMVNHTIGTLAYKAAQHSDVAFEKLAKSCFSKGYNLSKDEQTELYSVVRRRNGVNYFTSSAS